MSAPAVEAYRALLQSVVDVARAIFAARASSVFVHDRQTDELVFEAVSGEGASLVGRRFPSSAGLAGWVLVTGNPIVVEDVRQDPRFAIEVGGDTGYVPQGLMAVPLRRDDAVLGVLEVLDRPRRPEFSLDEVELLSMFADQATIALHLLRRTTDPSTSEHEGRLVRIASLLADLDDEGRDEGRQLLIALERVLRRARRDRV